MASLRARLLAGLLILTAIGMLLLAGITYAEQRSFLLERVDQQASGSIGPIAVRLASGAAPVDPDDRFGGTGGYDSPGLGPGSGGGSNGGPGGGPPPGTYVQAGDERGHPVGAGFTLQTLGRTTAPDIPDLPSALPVGKAVTVGSTGSGDTRFRVIARPAPAGLRGTTIVAIPLTEVDETLHRLLLVSGLVILGVLVLIGAAAWTVVRVGLLPLDRMGRTAGRIAGGDLSHRVTDVDHRTEVGRLGIALNAMLDRLEEAFAERQESEDRLRQFLADASHELRTPLTSIRGYAELFRMGAVTDPEQLAGAIRRIEEEAARMGVLVEDLLTLARMDQVAEVPHTEVDLVPIAQDAAGDARATAPDRAITVDAVPAAPIRGDGHQLRQLLGNLLRNALVHTPAGTPIEVGVTRVGGSWRLTVRDHGPGLPEGDPAALFERFWRAEGGRERGRDGAGLGLAIVAAIVERHGGAVTAADAPGGGAVFTVDLPALHAPAPGTPAASPARRS